MSTIAVSVAAAPSATLFELEQDLQALLDTEALVPAEQEAEFRRELGDALKASIAKRDRVAQFIRFCELQQANCDDEIARLAARKRTFAIAEKRIREYVAQVIENLGTDAKGKYPKLEGNLATLSLRALPASVEIEGEGKVTPEWKTISLRMPLWDWVRIACAVFNQDSTLAPVLRQAADSALVSVRSRRSRRRSKAAA